MSVFKQGGYSWLITPISYAVDLSIINSIGLMAFFYEPPPLQFILIVSIAWITSALISKFYDISRNSNFVRLSNLLARQAVVFSLFMFAYAGISQNYIIATKQILKYLLFCFFFISFFKYAIFFLLTHYRAALRRNIRKTIILGDNPRTKDLIDFFEETPETGFVNTKSVSFKGATPVDLEALFNYIKENNVQEIYCSLSEIPPDDFKAIIKFADNNLKVVKFIPEQNTVLNKELKREFYGLVPILEFRSIPLNEAPNQIVKRMFDIVFSILVIGLILSWLTPLLALFIRMESKGPIFFVQDRNGHNYKPFRCIKFRSMVINQKANHLQASKADSRITKVGKFMRQTSIDELPQFINVLLGDMSVVGPRP
ncbi:MAG: sugar transferase, partial [Bacteroidota bacterium]|nr:sugar transferase [Bacteroidota bacterium]